VSRDEVIRLVVERDQLITARDAQIVAMAGELSELRKENEALAGKLARLEHLLSGNSKNSSGPPSKDEGPGKTPPPVDTRRGGGSTRSKGKQPGAGGANLAWTESPDQRLERFPEGRCECGHDLADATDLGVVDRYPQHEIPEVRVKVTQYDRHSVRCGCGKVHTAPRRGPGPGWWGMAPICKVSWSL
jgi:transposase